MSAPSTSRPSSKGYAPVPIEERIDDGVEPQQEEAEADDDDGLYNTSAPLLSDRSRGNEPSRSQGQFCWYHKLGSWMPFHHRDPHYATWDAPNKKARNWRKIFFWTFLGALMTTILALSISTGVLAKKLSSCENRGCYRYYQPYRRTTRVPLNEADRSSNDRLNFVLLYPPLKASPSSACQAAWNTLTYVPCHEKIWNRSWDNGKHHSLFDPDIGLYADALCSLRCTEAINRAFQLISSQCTEEDQFDMTDYVGSFSADPGLEDGPLGVITTIAKRLTHTCRQEPTKQEYYWQASPYCAAVMWEDWFIVDGFNGGNLEGLDAFETRTRISKIEPPTYKYHNAQDTCDDISSYYHGRRIDSRRYGPSVNSTTCGWCTMNWFERKLLSWKKDEVQDPKTGKNVKLPDYLRRIQHAGERCDADAWDRVWARAISKYKASGDLPDDWENDGKSGGKPNKPGKPDKPCKDEVKGADSDGFVHVLPILPGQSN